MDTNQNEIDTNQNEIENVKQYVNNMEYLKVNIFEPMLGKTFRMINSTIFFCLT